MMSEQRLGDVIDDHCIKCRRITNHSIVSLVEGQAAKVRCRTCYHDHDYRHEIAPPTKKELKKAEAEAQALLAAQNGDSAADAQALLAAQNGDSAADAQALLAAQNGDSAAEAQAPGELKSKGGHA